MARSRRTLDRKALRADSEAAERRKSDDDLEEGEDEEESDEDEDEEEEAEASGDEEEGDEGEEGDEEEKPKPKPKPKKKAPAKPRATKARTRTPKVTRMKVVWGVFNNSHQMVEEFDYPRRRDAEELVAKLTTDKKSGHPFFLQPVKKPLDKP
jgi:cobalamin biosynthesis protein CobT